jgi:DNA sulfur modification protein DndE
MPPLDRIKLSQTGKDQLIKLKRVTKIPTWNLLCRWALCRSLAEPSIPSPVPIPTDSNLEISWAVFGGPIADPLLIALTQRRHQDGLGTDPTTLATQLRLHLHRCIGYLADAIADAELQAAAYALAWPYQYPHLPITALATLHVTPYSLRENLILDPHAIAQLQGQFLKRLRGFGAAYSGRSSGRRAQGGGGESVVS